MAKLTRDDSFKKPGAIPFEWETQPGVSKFKPHHNKELPPVKSSSFDTSSSVDTLAPSKELQNQWIQSMKLSTHNKNRASMSSMARIALSSGKTWCSITWSRWWKWVKVRTAPKPKLKLTLVLDPECVIKDKNTFYLDKLAGWSISSPPRSSTSSASTRIQRTAPEQHGFHDDDEAGPSSSPHMQRAVSEHCAYSNDDEASQSFSTLRQRTVSVQSGFSDDEEARPSVSTCKQSAGGVSNDDVADARLRIFNSWLSNLRMPKKIGTSSQGREKKEIKISVYLVNKKD